MDNIISIYKKLIITEVTYETGDDVVTASCQLVLPTETIETKLIITHTDLNRIISKIAAMGFEFKTEMISSFSFEDGTEFMEYKFENVFGEQIALENFQFSQKLMEIRA